MRAVLLSCFIVGYFFSWLCSLIFRRRPSFFASTPLSQPSKRHLVNILFSLTLSFLREDYPSAQPLISGKRWTRGSPGVPVVFLQRLGGVVRIF